MLKIKKNAGKLYSFLLTLTACSVLQSLCSRACFGQCLSSFIPCYCSYFTFFVGGGRQAVSILYSVSYKQLIAP
jgi:hypothetical protein